MNKTTPLALAAASVLVLVGGAAITGSAAQADQGDQDTTMPARPAQKALVQTCGGGRTVAMLSRTMDFQSVAGGTTIEVEGSSWQVKGPRKGTDTVLVTLTSMASSGGAGELTSVQFYKNGVGTGGSKYYTYNNILDQATVSFCTKIGKGNHTLALRATDQSGGATAMYYPTVTYQRFS